MDTQMISELQTELQLLKENNLYKKERIITSPQAALIKNSRDRRSIKFLR
jgi:hypothetical protein